MSREAIKTFRLSIHNFIIKPSPDEVGIEVVIKGGLREVFKLACFLRQHNIGIRHLDWSDIVNGNILLFMIVDVRASDYSLRKLMEVLSGWEEVIDIRVSPRIDNVAIYTNRLFPIYINGDRIILFSQALIKGMLAGIRKDLGIELASALLYRQGYDMGRSYYESYFIEHTSQSTDRLIKLLDALLTSLGWARLVDYKIYDENKIELSFSNLWECEVLGRSDKPCSFFFRGFLAGLFERFRGAKVNVREVECIAMGHPYCKFMIEVT